MRISPTAPLIAASLGLPLLRILAVYISGWTGVLGVLGDPAIITAQGVSAVVIGILASLCCRGRFHFGKWILFALGYLLAWRIVFIAMKSLSTGSFFLYSSLVFDLLEWGVVIAAAALVGGIVERSRVAADRSGFEGRTAYRRS